MRDPAGFVKRVLALHNACLKCFGIAPSSFLSTQVLDLSTTHFFGDGSYYRISVGVPDAWIRRREKIVAEDIINIFKKRGLISDKNKYECSVYYTTYPIFESVLISYPEDKVDDFFAELIACYNKHRMLYLYRMKEIYEELKLFKGVTESCGFNNFPYREVITFTLTSTKKADELEAAGKELNIVFTRSRKLYIDGADIFLSWDIANLDLNEIKNQLTKLASQFKFRLKIIDKPSAVREFLPLILESIKQNNQEIKEEPLYQIPAAEQAQAAQNQLPNSLYEIYARTAYKYHDNLYDVLIDKDFLFKAALNDITAAKLVLGSKLVKLLTPLEEMVPEIYAAHSQNLDFVNFVCNWNNIDLRGSLAYVAARIENFSGSFANFDRILGAQISSFFDWGKIEGVLQEEKRKKEEWEKSFLPPKPKPQPSMQLPHNLTEEIKNAINDLGNESPLELLELDDTENKSENFTAEQLNKAYRKVALKCHPDKGGDPEKFKLLDHAKIVLLDHEARRYFFNKKPEALKGQVIGNEQKDQPKLGIKQLVLTFGPPVEENKKTYEDEIGINRSKKLILAFSPVSDEFEKLLPISSEYYDQSLSDTEVHVIQAMLLLLQSNISINIVKYYLSRFKEHSGKLHSISREGGFSLLTLVFLSSNHFNILIQMDIYSIARSRDGIKFLAELIENGVCDLNTFKESCSRKEFYNYPSVKIKWDDLPLSAIAQLLKFKIIELKDLFEFWEKISSLLKGVKSDNWKLIAPDQRQRLVNFFKLYFSSQISDEEARVYFYQATFVNPWIASDREEKQPQSTIAQAKLELKALCHFSQAQSLMADLKEVSDENIIFIYLQIRSGKLALTDFFDVLRLTIRGTVFSVHKDYERLFVLAKFVPKIFFALGVVMGDDKTMRLLSKLKLTSAEIAALDPERVCSFKCLINIFKAGWLDEQSAIEFCNQIMNLKEPLSSHQPLQDVCKVKIKNALDAGISLVKQSFNELGLGVAFAAAQNEVNAARAANAAVAALSSQHSNCCVM